MQREIREELDVNIEVLDFFGESIYAYHSGTIKLMAFWCKWISGEFTLKVHSNLAWVNRHELDLYDFAPADIPLVEKLKAVMSQRCSMSGIIYGLYEQIINGIINENLNKVDQELVIKDTQHRCI